MPAIRLRKCSAPQLENNERNPCVESRSAPL